MSWTGDDCNRSGSGAKVGMFASGRQFPPTRSEVSSVIKRLADYCYVYPEAAGKRMIELASRVIVPAEAVEQARTILKALRHPPPVTSLEGVALYEDPAPV